MKILPLSTQTAGGTTRDGINIYEFKGVRVTGPSLYYPNPLLYTYERNSIPAKLINPIEERTMSLAGVESRTAFEYDPDDLADIHYDPVFYFIYNTDNYYHFIYDTLPYLLTYKELKDNMGRVKLLMNYPNPDKKKFYRFVVEFLELLGISKDDIIIADPDTYYATVLVSATYTYGDTPDTPPHPAVYKIYDEIVTAARTRVNENTREFSKRIYVSRRSWMHGDTSNMGTDYTTRRMMENEGALVVALQQRGFEEVFAEKLTTIEKVLMFSQAEVVIGAIGGGLANVLFSTTGCQLYAIVSPTFLEVNSRFVHVFSGVNTKFFFETKHVDDDEFKQYMRVRCGANIVGEISDINGDDITFLYSPSTVAGWNSLAQYIPLTTNKKYLEKIDDGLNCKWTMNIDKFKELLDESGITGIRIP